MGIEYQDFKTDLRPEISTLVAENIPESRVEDLQKIEKFISLDKLQDFRKGIN